MIQVSHQTLTEFQIAKALKQAKLKKRLTNDEFLKMLLQK